MTEPIGPFLLTRILMHSSPIAPVPFWQLKTRRLTFERGPAIMGIVNVTPDSFSDGGRYASTADAVAHGVQLAADGADILDVGGESTRPYSAPVGVQEELDRAIPVIEQLVGQTEIPISIDTSKASVAAAAMAAGAEIINDVTGLEGDPEMIGVAVKTGAGVCAMHMRGTPQTMQDDPVYQDVTEEILRYLAQRKSALEVAGVDPARICLDPGIGFGKTHQHNVQLIRDAARFHQSGAPILVGHSRKGFVGQLLGDKQADRDAGTLGLSVMLAMAGVQVIRVHEVAQTVQAIRCVAGVRAIQS